MSDNFWKVFVTSGLFAAAVGGVVGFAVTKLFPTTVAAETKKVGDEARAIIKTHNFDGWPTAIRCYDDRGSDVQKVYHLNVIDFPSDNVSGRVIGYRHIWINVSGENRTQDVEFSMATKKIVFSETANAHNLINCNVGAELTDVVGFYREIDR